MGDRIDDFDGNGIDLIDLKNTLHLVIAPSETALINAVNSKFERVVG